MRDLIIGTLQGYRHMPTVDITGILPYVASMQKSGIAARRVMFVNRVPRDVISFLKQNGFEVIKYRSYTGRASRILRQALDRTCSRIPDFSGWHYALKKYFWHCQASRYLLYRDYLANQSDICQVVISDVRDVIFQRDPFGTDSDKQSAHDQFLTSEEHQCHSIGDHAGNRNLILTLFGSERLDELSNLPIICSGVSMGSRNKMIEYLNVMTGRLLHSYEPVGYDQGVHIDVIYKKVVGGVKIFRFGEGPIIHLAIAPRDEIKTNAEGEVLDRLGEVVPIVHQYDRHKDLTQQIFKRFSNCNLTSKHQFKTQNDQT